MTYAWTNALREAEAVSAFMPSAPSISSAVVIKWACWEFEVTENQLLSQRRQAMLVMARSFIAWSMRSLGKPRSYAEIGELLGGYASGAVVHMHQKALDQRRRDPAFDAICERMRQRYGRMVLLREGSDHA